MLLGLGCACLLAFGFATAPRLFLVIAWIFSDRWKLVWQGNWFVPLLGIIFLPYTLIMYMLSYDVVVGAVTGWGWLWVILGVVLDVMHWGQIYDRRKEVPYASEYTGGSAAAPTESPVEPPKEIADEAAPAESPVEPPKEIADEAAPAESPVEPPEDISEEVTDEATGDVDEGAEKDKPA